MYASLGSPRIKNTYAYNETYARHYCYCTNQRIDKYLLNSIHERISRLISLFHTPKYFSIHIYYYHPTNKKIISLMFFSKQTTDVSFFFGFGNTFRFFFFFILLLLLLLIVFVVIHEWFTLAHTHTHTRAHLFTKRFLVETKLFHIYLAFSLWTRFCA